MEGALSVSQAADGRVLGSLDARQASLKTSRVSRQPSQTTTSRVTVTVSARAANIRWARALGTPVRRTTQGTHNVAAVIDSATSWASSEGHRRS